MTEDDMRKRVRIITDLIADKMPAAKSADDRAVAQCAMIAAELLGELFIDIKRIADAAAHEGST